MGDLINLLGALLVISVMGWGLPRWFRWRNDLYRRIVDTDVPRTDDGLRTA